MIPDQTIKLCNIMEKDIKSMRETVTLLICRYCELASKSHGYKGEIDLLESYSKAFDQILKGNETIKNFLISLKKLN